MHMPTAPTYKLNSLGFFFLLHAQDHKQLNYHLGQACLRLSTQVIHANYYLDILSKNNLFMIKHRGLQEYTEPQIASIESLNTDWSCYRRGNIVLIS